MMIFIIMMMMIMMIMIMIINDDDNDDDDDDDEDRGKMMAAEAEIGKWEFLGVKSAGWRDMGLSKNWGHPTIGCPC